MVVCWHGILYPVEDLKVLLCDALKLSFSSIFIERMAIFYILILIVNGAFVLMINKMCHNSLENINQHDFQITIVEI